jgi:sporulation protein YlmC with PRC-barrel domain
MALYGNLRDYKFGDAADDIRGTDVYGANDEKLGTIDDVIFDSNSGEMKYVVVDTGGMMTSNRFIVPARQIQQRDDLREADAADRYYVPLNKEQIERFPQYDEKALENEKDFGDYEKRYEESWTTAGDVMHVEGSTRILTPEASEMPAPVGGTARFEDSGRSLKPIARDLPRFGATSDNESSSRSGGLVDDRELEPVSPIEEPVGSVEGEERVTEMGRDLDDGRVELSREEFLKEGTLRSEYDAPLEPADMRDRRQGERHSAEMRRRWDDFQNRLRNEREQIMNRPRKDRAA